MRLRNSCRSEGYLVSRIPVRAVASTGMGSVAERLRLYPSLTQLGRGTSLRYMLRTEQSDHFYIIALEKHEILLEIYAKETPLYLFGDAMLKLLSLFGVLEGLYTFDIAGLFPYMVWVLGRQQLAEHPMQEAERRHDISSDLVLARRILGLAKERQEADARAERWHLRAIHILAKLMVYEHSCGFSIEDIAKEHGIAQHDVLDAIEAMSSIGYRAVRTGRGSFALARI